MKKFLNIICLVSILCLTAYAPQVWSIEKKPVLSKGTPLVFTTFLNYKPFGAKGNSSNDITTVFQPFVDGLSQKYMLRQGFDAQGTYDSLIFKVVEGEIDVILGAYYETNKYNGIKLIYPALLTNPLVLVTMPGNSLQIKTKSDLKKLKGAIDSREYFSDFVVNELQEYNLQSFDDSEKLYEQLFVGNIDYILTSRYYGALEQAKLGIRKLVVMSKNALWDMPLFIGTSALTPKGKKIAKTIQDYLKTDKDSIQKQIEQALINQIYEADQKAIGLVPPAFVK